jgi:uncharacterized protein YbcI
VSVSETGERRALPAEISDSLAVVWRRYAGRRPTDVETVVRGNRICCVLKDSVRGFEEGLAAVESGGEGKPARTIAQYRREAVDAVTRASRRRVMAFVSDHDPDSDVATEVFILDRPPRRQSSIFLDRRPD